MRNACRILEGGYSIDADDEFFDLDMALRTVAIVTLRRVPNIHSQVGKLLVSAASLMTGLVMIARTSRGLTQFADPPLWTPEWPILIRSPGTK